MSRTKTVTMQMGGNNTQIRKKVILPPNHNFTKVRILVVTPFLQSDVDAIFP